MVLASRELHAQTGTLHRLLGVLMAAACTTMLAIRFFIESAPGIQFVIAAYVYSVMLAIFAVLTYLLCSIDWAMHRLPNDATALFALLCCAIFIVARIFTNTHTPWWQAICLALAFPLVLFVMHLMRRSGLGLGDVKLGVGLGLLMANYHPLTGFIGLAIALIGTLIHLLIVLRKSSLGLQTRVAFGPWLLLGASTAVFMS